MSILSTIRAGLAKFHDAATAIEHTAEAVYAKLPAAFHPAVDAVVSDIKQAASDAVTAADKAEGPAITSAATLVESAAEAALTRYLGNPAEQMLSGPLSDAVDRVRDALIAELHLVALNFKAKLATPIAGASTEAGPVQTA